MRFNEIFALEDVKKELLNGISRNRIAHSQVFTGPKGSPKIALALAYAQYINCFNKTKTDSCNTCNSCVKYSKLSHPDLHIIFPVIKTSKCTRSVDYLPEWRNFFTSNIYSSLDEWSNFMGDKNPFIYTHEFTSTKECVDSSRLTLYNKLALKNFESKYRVVIIWGPEKMLKIASNKLLKFLEEPPEGTIFLLVSDEINSLLPTINSRLQKTFVPKYTESELIEFYTQKFGPDVHGFSKKADGDISYLLSLQGSTQEIELLRDFTSWMRLCFKQDFLELTNWVVSISKRNVIYQKKLLNFAISTIRNSLINNFVDNKMLLTSTDEKEFVLKFSKFVNEENSILLILEFENSIGYLSRNINAKILFFELSLQISKMLRIKSSKD